MTVVSGFPKLSQGQQPPGSKLMTLPPSHRFSALLYTLGLLATIALTSAGCGKNVTKELPRALKGVSPQLVQQLGGLHFVRDPGTGYQLASEQGLPCLLFFTAKWCTYCHQMEETAFADPTIHSLAQGFCVHRGRRRPRAGAVPTLRGLRIPHDSVCRRGRSRLAPVGRQTISGQSSRRNACGKPTIRLAKRESTRSTVANPHGAG